MHAGFIYAKAEVVWMVRNEMARTIEDVLSRRMRLLFLDAKGALALAPAVAKVMATELGKDDQWINAQIEEFTALVKQYLLYTPIKESFDKTEVKMTT